MATSTSKVVPIKRLAELLQEQQDPFVLDVFLTERRGVKKSSSTNIRDGHLRDNSAENLKRTCSFKAKRRMGLRNGSKFLRLLINKLISNKTHRKLSSNNCKARKDEKFSVTARKQKHVALKNQVCSSSSINLFHSCSESHSEDHFSAESTFGAKKLHNLRDLEADTTKLQWGYIEDSKQLSSVSMVQLLQSDQVSHYLIAKQEETLSTSSLIMPRKATENSMFFTSLCDLLDQSLSEKQNSVGIAELQGFRSDSSQYLKAERVLMQTKQLLCDCVKEAIDTHGKQGKWKSIRKVLVPEELTKIICEQICSWGKQSGDVRNITQLITSDFSTTIEEWSDFQLLNRDIGMEIGEAILDEIVTEMINIVYRD